MTDVWRHAGSALSRLEHPMEKQKLNYWSQFLIRFIPAALILCALLLPFALKDASHQERILKDHQQIRLNYISKAVSIELAGIFQNLFDLSRRLSVARYMEDPSPERLRDVARSYLFFSEVNPDFDQIRLLDARGMEILRINRQGNKSTLVPEKDLQDKSDRYYYQDAAKLLPGEIYASPLDLNVEKGAIETPYKPMLRVAAPLRDTQGRLRGVLVLNYLGAAIFDLLEREADNSAKLMLLNSAGYWLYGGGDKDWAFMFKDRRNDSFANAEPEIWRAMAASPSGQIMTPQGLYAFDVLEFSPDALPGSARFPARTPQAFRQRWKIVSFIPARVIFEARWQSWPSYAAGALMILGVTALGCALYVSRESDRLRASRIIRENQERFRSLVETSPDIIWEMNRDGVFTYVSPRSKSILGYAPDELTGAPLTKIMSEDLALEAMERITGGDPPDGARPQANILQCRHADGSLVELEVRGVPAFDANGTLLGRRGAARDVTQDRKNQRILEQTRQEAFEANKAKSEFLARMSHEIRTPLNAIVGMTHLAMRTRLDFKQRDYLAKIKTSSDSLLGIINDILDFSKIEAGRLTIEKVPFNLESMFGNVVDMSSLQAEEQNLEFLVSIGRDVPLGLVGDPLRLGQVLINLVGNAIKFTEQGEVILKAALEEKTPDQARIHFSVRDTGIGMDGEQISRLFQPFSQADGSISRRFGGTGLGLSICQRLVKLMGGDLSLRSQPGQGSEFSFSLPFSLACELPVPAFQAETSATAGTPVLVIDDNASSRQILGDALISMRFVPKCAASAEEGLRILKDEPGRYKAVLLDWRMPGMNGAQCAARIKALDQPEKPAIIIVTAYGQREVRKELENVGVDALLLKPIPRSALYNALAECLGFAEAKTDAQPDPDEERMSGLFKGLRVLLVEDNVINQQVARELLESFGLETSIAGSGERALELLEKQRFAAVFMDLRMPGMGGLEASRRIREKSGLDKMPIIAMTAHAMRQDHLKTAAAGMNDHVNKPIDPALLLDVLKRWLPWSPSGPDQEAVPVASQPEETIRTGVTDFDELPVLDPELGLARVRGKRSLYQRLLAEFQDKYGGVAAAVDDCLDRDDDAEARALIHAFTGVSGNLGFMRLYDIARRLDECLDESPKACRESLKLMGPELERAFEAISSYQSELGETEGPDGDASLYDPEQLIRSLNDLRDLLAKRDARSMDLLEEIHPSLAALDPALAGKFATSLNQMKFQEAMTFADAFSGILRNATS